MELLCDTYQAAQGFGFSTVPLASLALGHVTASSLLVTCAGRLKSLCWVSRSLCIFFFLSQVENVRWGEINVLSHSFWFKISLSIEPLSTGLLKRIIYSSHWAKMSPLALIEIKEQFCLKRIPFLTLLSLETFVCNFCNLKQISSIYSLTLWTKEEWNLAREMHLFPHFPSTGFPCFAQFPNHCSFMPYQLISPVTKGIIKRLHSCTINVQIDCEWKSVFALA